MALRAILRRKRSPLKFLGQPGCSAHISSSSECKQSSFAPDPWSSTSSLCHLPPDDDSRKDRRLFWLTREKLVVFSAADLLQQNSNAYPAYRSITGIPQYVQSLRSTPKESIRYASTAAASQPEPHGDNNENEEKVFSQVKEPSPEQCDQAVEGLSSAKAKAKVKQLQDYQKEDKPLMQRVWATLLGIGPAFRVVASMSREDWAKKLVHWKDEFKSAMQHYWLGTKLLWVDVRISMRLLLKLANGKNLSRRERKQLTRTTADIFRLVPFAVFIIVPFMEFLLPVALKLFPDMLPSTFKDKMKEQEDLKRRLNARIEYAKFLQSTVKEMAKEVQNSRSGDIKKTAEDLDEFMNKVRTGAPVTNDEILGFAKLFNDELTLDNISRPRLVNMCKYMGIMPIGTDAYLRFMLRNRLRMIKEDDKMIQSEGVESLSEAELRQACRDRGLLGLLSVQEMRQQLRDWLDLSLHHAVPSSLLILSRAFNVSGKVRPEEAVQATLSSLPEEVIDTVQATSMPSEDSVSERRRKLEFLEMQEELIKEEEKKEEKEQAKMKESVVNEKDVALEEMMDATARESQGQIEAEIPERQDQLCELSHALAILSSSSSVTKEREEFLRLVKKEIELYNSMVDKEAEDGEVKAEKAYRAARNVSNETVEESERAAGDKISSALIERVDAMLHKLEKDIDDVDTKIGDRWWLLDRDYDGKVTPEEVASAAMYLKDTLDKDGIQELISSLSKDREGRIRVEDIVRLASRTKVDEDTNRGGGGIIGSA